METISCKDARDHFAEVISKVAYGHKRYTLTRRGSEMGVFAQRPEKVYSEMDVLISFDEGR